MSKQSTVERAKEWLEEYECIHKCKCDDVEPIIRDLLTIIERLPSEWVLKLAADFLDELGDRYGNDGCNDYDVPEWVPKGELIDLYREYDECDGHDDAILSYNWAVVGAVKHAILTAAEAAREKL